MNEEETALRSALNQAGVSLMREGNNLVVDMQSDMLFEADSASLTPMGRDLVMSLSRVVKRYPSTYINVDGFTDTAGRHESNVRISQDRADAVADILAEDGVETRRLTAVGHGEEYLRVPTAEGVNEARNRRVQITLEPYAG
jgi:outer membrane protein OmpA-like peptidoglycan-associated protein